MLLFGWFVVGLGLLAVVGVACWVCLLLLFIVVWWVVLWFVVLILLFCRLFAYGWACACGLWLYDVVGVLFANGLVVG